MSKHGWIGWSKQLLFVIEKQHGGVSTSFMGRSVLIIPMCTNCWFGGLSGYLLAHFVSLFLHLLLPHSLPSLSLSLCLMAYANWPATAWGFMEIFGRSNSDHQTSRFVSFVVSLKLAIKSISENFIVISVFSSLMNPRFFNAGIFVA